MASDIKTFFVGRLIDKATTIELDLSEGVINNALVTLVFEFLGMVEEYGCVGPTYNAKNKGAEKLVMPIIHERAQKFVNDVCNEAKFKAKLLKKTVADAKKQGNDNFYRLLRLYENACARKCDVIADTAINTLAYKMACEDARAVFDQGTAQALEKLKAEVVVSVHDGMDCRSDDVSECGETP